MDTDGGLAFANPMSEKKTQLVRFYLTLCRTQTCNLSSCWPVVEHVYLWRWLYLRERGFQRQIPRDLRFRISTQARRELQEVRVAHGV